MSEWFRERNTERKKDREKGKKNRMRERAGERERGDEVTLIDTWSENESAREKEVERERLVARAIPEKFSLVCLG